MPAAAAPLSLRGCIARWSISYCGEPGKGLPFEHLNDHETMRSRAAMRSRCSGVSGGNESTMARTCSASTAARSRVAGSVMLGGPCGIQTGCLREDGSDPGESVASISGAVAVGRACSALVCVLLALSRCFEWLGLFVRYISFLEIRFPFAPLGAGDVRSCRRVHVGRVECGCCGACCWLACGGASMPGVWLYLRSRRSVSGRASDLGRDRRRRGNLAAPRCRRPADSTAT
jgi:hypothetical protein